MNDVSSEKKKHIVILGGGPCGLYAGRTLSRDGHHVTILDKGKQPGGLATSNRFGNNWYDFGVHMLHAFDKEIFEDIKEIMKDERIEVQLDALIKWRGQHFRYPLQFTDMIKGIPPFILFYQIIGLFTAQIKHSLFPKKVENAEQALIQLYGKPLYNFFFRDFTHRYWGVHPKKLSATFITTKMPKLSAVDILKRWFAKLGFSSSFQTTESALSQETLHYSRSGAEAMTRLLAKRIVDDGNIIIQEAFIKKIYSENGAIKKVQYQKDNILQDITCDICISTIPITHLAQSLVPAPVEDIQNSINQLVFKPLVIYGLLIKKKRCLNALYVYYRSRIFHRIAEPKNAGLVVDPEDHTVLIVEMTCEKNDEKWNGFDSIKQQLYKELAEEGVCQKSDIVELHLSHYETAYPVFSLGFEVHLNKLKSFIDNFSNLQSVGRQGAFTYPNMHTAMRMGYDAAKKIE